MTSFILPVKKNRKDNIKTLKQLGEEYINYLKNNNCSIFTIKSYTQKIDRLQTYLDLCEIENLKGIDDKVIDGYKKFLLKTNRDSSVNVHLSHLKTVFNYAFKHGYVSEKLEFKPLRAEQKPKKVYSKDDIYKLISEKPRESFTQYECRVIITTFIGTGLRLSELISLQVRDLDLENEVLYTRHTKSKRQRILPLNKSLKDLLEEWLDVRKYENLEDSLFCNSYGESLCISTLRTMLTRYMKKYGVKDSSIHQFRRTYITHAISKNIDIISLSRLTGHRRLQTLSLYYVDNMELQKQLQNKINIIEDVIPTKQHRKRLNR